MYKKYKKGGEVDPKYKKAGESEQTPEQKLVQALRSQGRGAEDLLTLLQAMRSPTEQERRTAMFSDEPTYEAPGRAYRTTADRVLYQPATEEGELQGTGRAIGRGDVRTITGGRSELSSRQETDIARMLRDPAVMRFFMDVYGEAGKARKPRTATLSGGRPSESCQPDRQGRIPESCKKGPKASGVFGSM
jgi:hypothetical protein